MTRAVRQVERFGEYSYVYVSDAAPEALIAKLPGDCHARGGEVLCRNAGNRVMLAGRAAVYLEGTISV